MGPAARTSSTLLDAVGADFDVEAFLAGETTPVFFGSALTNFGVRLLLDAVDRPGARARARAPTSTASPAPLDAPFSGFVFKVQANMDPSHRDRIAFLRVCSGRFERGHGRHPRPHRQAVRHQVRAPRCSARSGRRSTRPSPATSSAWSTPPTSRVGDTLYARRARRRSPAIPSFAPEHFAVARVRDTGRFKQFRRGIAQLDEEGVVQVLRDPDQGDQAPVLAAVGPMQFEVAVHRLENEFGAPVELSPTTLPVARRTDDAGAEALRGMRGVTVLSRADGTLLALFESPYWVERLEQEQPELMLDRLVAEGSVG